QVAGRAGENRGEHRYILTVPGRGYRFVADVKRREDASTRTGISSVSSSKTIAVLPFMPLVAEYRDAALEMGMADTLIARLSNIREVVVRPINSVRKYAELDQDPLAAGQELGVESVLEESIQRWGNYIRVTVRLVNVPTGASLWTGTFDERFTNIFAVQDAIAEKVAGALALRFSGEEKQRLIKRHTENAEAYELYLRGRYHFVKLIPSETQKGISYFKRAIEIDPAYALAHVGLADAYRSLALADDMPATEVFPKAKAAAQKAVAIDDTLAEAHAGQTDEALARLQQTSELDPNYWLAHLFTSGAYIEKGMYPEAVAEARKARALSGVSSQPTAYEGYALAKSGRQREARVVLEQLLKLSTERYVPPYYIALVYNGLGERDETFAWLERGVAQRDPKLTFLKVEPKWNNLRDDPCFTAILKHMSLDAPSN